MKPMTLLCLLFALMLVAGGCRKQPTESRQQSASETDKKPAVSTVTVGVPNSDGSITVVNLRRQGAGYVGPRGEYYDHLPTGEELKPIYGD